MGRTGDCEAKASIECFEGQAPEANPRGQEVISFKPDIICVDFETADSRGASLQYWRDDFRVLSASATWRKSDGEFKSIFRKGEAATEAMLAKFINDGVPIVAHNAAFEVGVTMARFPSLDVKAFTMDTMRMVQEFDSGGKALANGKHHGLMTIDDQYEALTKDDEVQKPSIGLGLEASVRRILPESYHNHKEPFYEYLRTNHGIPRRQEGKHLHLLPDDMLEKYNIADTEVTLALYYHLMEQFRLLGYTQYDTDMKLHMSAIRRICKSQIRGIKVNSERLALHRETVEKEQKDIIDAFRASVATVLLPIEEQRKEEWITALKSEKGQVKRRETAEDHRSEWGFNPRSTAQLTDLFVNRLKRPVTFMTKPGKNVDKEKFVPKPSFRAAHLSSYGPEGELLSTLKKRQIVERQITNLITLAVYDGRWHNGLKACGTKTGRYTGSSAGDARLNIQALARKEEEFMRNLIADPGKLFVSCDLSAGEPTIACHFSNDKNYKAFCFDMIGKQPYYFDNILYTDDIYLGLASVSPTGRDKVKELYHSTWGSVPFNEQWLIDKDVILKEAKSFRQAHKVFFLALMYGSSYVGLTQTAYNFGFSLTTKDSKALHTSFWNILFTQLRDLRDRLTAKVERDGSLVNTFGFRMTPESPRLALNYLIQGSVSGAIKCLEELVQEEAPYAEWVSNIHDETLWQIPVDSVDRFREANLKAVANLNSQLGWRVPIRTGFVVGDNLYTAK